MTAVNMHAAKLGTAVKLRENLAGIEKLLGIKCALHPLLLLQIILGKHFRHQVSFLHSDTVFTCKYTANLDTKLEYL